MNNELLDKITASTLKNKGTLWLENLHKNEKDFGFKKTIREINPIKAKSLVLAAGPESKKIFGENFKVINQKRKDLTIVACDGALKMLSSNDCIPDYIVSVDGDPIIANFYKNSKELLNGVTVILATTIHPDVVQHCIDGGAKIRWVQPFFKDTPHTEFFRKGIPSIKMGGNVGTASYLFTSLVLKGNPIGLMGIEFAWSDETPYSQTQYYEKLMEALDQKSEKVKKQFVHVKNKVDGKTYIADPVYYAYSLMFKEIWDEELSLEIKQRTYNLTMGGILSMNDLKGINIENFLEISN
jgi:hypothetical protein